MACGSCLGSEVYSAGDPTQGLWEKSPLEKLKCVFSRHFADTAWLLGERVEAQAWITTAVIMIHARGGLRFEQANAGRSRWRWKQQLSQPVLQVWRENHFSQWRQKLEVERSHVWKRCSGNISGKGKSHASKDTTPTTPAVHLLNTLL